MGNQSSSPATRKKGKGMRRVILRVAAALGIRTGRPPRSASSSGAPTEPLVRISGMAKLNQTAVSMVPAASGEEAARTALVDSLSRRGREWVLLRMLARRLLSVERLAIVAGVARPDSSTLADVRKVVCRLSDAPLKAFIVDALAQGAMNPTSIRKIAVEASHSGDAAFPVLPRHLSRRLSLGWWLELDAEFKEFDVRGRGQITLDEYTNVMRRPSRLGPDEDAAIVASFEDLDRGGKHYVTYADFAEVWVADTEAAEGDLTSDAEAQNAQHQATADTADATAATAAGPRGPRRQRRYRGGGYLVPLRGVYRRIVKPCRRLPSQSRASPLGSKAAGGSHGTSSGSAGTAGGLRSETRSDAMRVRAAGDASRAVPAARTADRLEPSSATPSSSAARATDASSKRVLSLSSQVWMMRGDGDDATVTASAAPSSIDSPTSSTQGPATMPAATAAAAAEASTAMASRGALGGAADEAPADWVVAAAAARGASSEAAPGLNAGVDRGGRRTPTLLVSQGGASEPPTTPGGGSPTGAAAPPSVSPAHSAAVSPPSARALGSALSVRPVGLFKNIDGDVGEEVAIKARAACSPRAGKPASLVDAFLPHQLVQLSNRAVQHAHRVFGTAIATAADAATGSAADDASSSAAKATDAAASGSTDADGAAPVAAAPLADVTPGAIAPPSPIAHSRPTSLRLTHPSAPAVSSPTRPHALAAATACTAATGAGGAEGAASSHGCGGSLGALTAIDEQGSSNRSAQTHLATVIEVEEAPTAARGGGHHGSSTIRAGQ